MVVLCHICSKQGAFVYILNSLLVHWVHYEYCIIGNIWLLSLYIVILNSMNFCVERCSGSIKRTWFMCFYEYAIYVWICFYVSNLFGIVRRHERRGRIASIFRFRRSSRILWNLSWSIWNTHTGQPFSCLNVLREIRLNCLLIQLFPYIAVVKIIQIIPHRKYLGTATYGLIIIKLGCCFG